MVAFILHASLMTRLFAEPVMCRYDVHAEERRFIDVKKQSVCGYPIVQYESLDFERLEVRKITNEVNLERSIYYDPVSNVYVKLWQPDFSRNRIFLIALSKGYYKDLAPLIGIIIDRNGKCRGYVTKSLDYTNLSVAVYRNNYDYICLQDVTKQNRAYRQFYDKIIERSEKIGFYYLDFVPGNIVTDHESYYLVDLESVFSIEELRTLYRIRPEEYLLILEHLPPDYAAFLELAILNDEDIDLDLLAAGWKIPTGGSNGQSYNAVTIQGVRFPGERAWDDRWELIKDAMDYRGKRVLELGSNVALASTYLLKYREVAECIGVDRPDDLLAMSGMPRLMEAAKMLHRAFNVNPKIVQMDINNTDYEKFLGFNYDVAFCMSFLKWVDDKERLLDYLSNFKHIIFEGHEADSIEIERFQQRGFDYRILGKTQVGVSYPKDAFRTLIYFFKSDEID